MCAEIVVFVYLFTCRTVTLKDGIPSHFPLQCRQHALGLVIEVLADDVADNHFLWRNDSRSHYQQPIGALINAQNQE